jgi:hypothetical protein
MLFYLRKNPRFGLVWLSVLGLIATLHSSPAHAYTILCQDIYYHGGSLSLRSCRTKLPSPTKFIFAPALA